MDERQYQMILEQGITQKRTFIVRRGGVAIGVIMLCGRRDSIDFWGVHPLYRNTGVERMLVRAAAAELSGHRWISTTTYREGDKADTGYRSTLLGLGFVQDQLLTEFDYPTQRFVLERAAV